jgi:hypothetical protein
MADVVCLPPAVQGSVVAAVQRYNPSAILVIDGGFQSEPAVRHREILWAISRGIPVIGAASMGALRAAELHPHMLGVGLAYRWYRRFAFAPDDAVAVLHGPLEVNFAPLTHALIDLRLTIGAARRRALISAELAATLDDAARHLNFRDRTVDRIVEEALPRVAQSDREHCKHVLTSVFIQQKKQDALEALQLLRADVFRSMTLTNFSLTTTFTEDLLQAGIEL